MIVVYLLALGGVAGICDVVFWHGKVGVFLAGYADAVRAKIGLH